MNVICRLIETRIAKQAIKRSLKWSVNEDIDSFNTSWCATGGVINS